MLIYKNYFRKNKWSDVLYSMFVTPIQIFQMEATVPREKEWTHLIPPYSINKKKVSLGQFLSQNYFIRDYLPDITF